MTPWTVACQAPPFIGFPRQEPWSGLSFPSPEDLPDAGIEPVSPALAGGFFTAKQREKYDCILPCTHEKFISQVASECVCVCVCTYIYYLCLLNREVKE